MVWLEAPESATQSVTGVGGVSAIVLKEPARDCGSHSPDHGVQDDGCCCGARGRGSGARGGVNGGPTCCAGEPKWGAAKKACCCCGGLDGAPPMDGPGHMLMVPVHGL